MSFQDTILALSSAPPNAQAPRALLRLSGPSAWQAAQALLPALPLATGFHHHLPLPLLHPALPIAAALLFQAPRSFTGEDIAELHLPASPALLAACADALLKLPGGGGTPLVRNATPGEFSARAFLNGKIDLTQAEGIAATIHATDHLERKAAASLKNGELHKEIDKLTNEIANLLALIEAGIDFTDEEDVSTFDEDLLWSSQVPTGIHFLLAHAVRVDRVHTLPTVAFVGLPNVGKSSLINALAQTDRSITSPIAGTTRDMLSVVMPTPRGPICLVDVPGEEPATDELRQKMMAAREQALLEADLVIEVLTHPEKVVSNLAILGQYAAHAVTVHNKIDLLPPEKRRTWEYDQKNDCFLPFRAEWQMVSATTGLNIDKLREEIIRLATNRSTVSWLPAINQRHRALLQQAKDAFDALLDVDNPTRHPELLASHLRHALDLLGQITGAISPDQILGRIFSTFCIGK